MRPNSMRGAAYLLALAIGPLSIGGAAAQPPPSAPLQLEEKILLEDVRGRIDHLAIDLTHKRLFVAELGNDTVGVVDLNARKVRHVITGFRRSIGFLSRRTPIRETRRRFGCFDRRRELEAQLAELRHVF
jgi:hypothetical protein